jgi:hypothetical protein
MEVEEQRNAPAQNTDAPEAQAEPKKETEQATTPFSLRPREKVVMLALMIIAGLTCLEATSIGVALPVCPHPKVNVECKSCLKICNSLQIANINPDNCTCFTCNLSPGAMGRNFIPTLQHGSSTSVCVLLPHIWSSRTNTSCSHRFCNWECCMRRCS